MTINALIYDLEIKKGILGKGEPPISGIEYCDGWHDHANMGISVLGAWCGMTSLPLVFDDHNKDLFTRSLSNYQHLVTFNGIGFDDKVIRACWDFAVPQYLSYDILRELWIADGLDPDRFEYRTHGGYGLDACARVNFGDAKSGDGASAPLLYQRGQIAELYSYCLKDVMLTRRLFMRIATNQGVIKHPKTGRDVKLRLVE